jgi:ribosomal-protein-alanine N-acetyltransferase
MRLPTVRDRRRAATTVVPMQRRHLSAVHRIESAGSARPWSRQVFIDEMANADRAYIVARRHRSVVGFAGLWIIAGPDGGEAHLTNISVDPGHRRSGVATALLVHLAHRAIAAGCTGWTLEVRRSSIGAQSLYRRFGFAPVGVRARYYGSDEDALIMWCHELQSAQYRGLIDRLGSPPAADTIVDEHRVDHTREHHVR